MWLNVTEAKLKSSQCWSAVVRESCALMWHMGFLESHVLYIPAVWGCAVCFEHRTIRLYCFFSGFCSLCVLEFGCFVYLFHPRHHDSQANQQQLSSDSLFHCRVLSSHVKCSHERDVIFYRVFTAWRACCCFIGDGWHCCRGKPVTSSLNSCSFAQSCGPH